MNIFITNICPVKSAQNLDDKRVIKMILESAQLLSTAIRYFNIEHKDLYKSTHVNHPSSVWVRQSKQNYMWTFNHYMALCNEYTNRYGKVHKSESLKYLLKEYSSVLPDIGLTDFANCARNKEHGLDYTNEDCVFTAYQKYLNARWETDKREPTWYGIRR